MTSPEDSPTADWWCWTTDEPSTFRCRELGHDIRPVRKLGDPSTAEWREAAGLPPLPPKWEGTDYLKRELVRVEQERDAVGVKLVGALREQAKAERERNELSDLVDKISAELTSVLKERDSLARRCSIRFEETQAAKAELASARQELAELRARQWIVARDGGRWCERCEGEIRRGEAYELQPGTGGLALHIRCPNPITEGALTT